MGIAVLGSIAAAATAISDKVSGKGGWVVISLGAVIVIAVLIGFLRRRPPTN